MINMWFVVSVFYRNINAIAMVDKCDSSRNF